MQKLIWADRATISPAAGNSYSVFFDFVLGSHLCHDQMPQRAAHFERAASSRLA
jgi:hypothetical protein